MLNLRRSTAAALLVGAVLVPALAAAPAHAAALAHAAGSSCATDPAAPADWTYYATYTNCADCEDAGLDNHGDREWQCVPSRWLPDGYDLYVRSSDGPGAPPAAR